MLIRYLCLKVGFSDATFYKWWAKCCGMDVSVAACYGNHKPATVCGNDPNRIGVILSTESAASGASMAEYLFAMVYQQETSAQDVGLLWAPSSMLNDHGENNRY